MAKERFSPSIAETSERLRRIVEFTAAPIWPEVEFYARYMGRLFDSDATQDPNYFYDVATSAAEEIVDERVYGMSRPTAFRNLPLSCYLAALPRIASIVLAEENAEMIKKRVAGIFHIPNHDLFDSAEDYVRDVVTMPVTDAASIQRHIIDDAKERMNLFQWPSSGYQELEIKNCVSDFLTYFANQFSGFFPLEDFNQMNPTIKRDLIFVFSTGRMSTIYNRNTEEMKFNFPSLRFAIRRLQGSNCLKFH